MGGESTAWAAPCKRSPCNSPRPPLEVELASAHLSYFSRFAGVLRHPWATGRQSSRNLRQSVAEIARYSSADGRIAEAFGADGDQRCTHVEELAGVAPTGDPTHADDRDRDTLRDARDLGERYRPDRRTRQPAAPAAEPGAGAVRRACGRPQRVDQRDRVGAAGLCAGRAGG